MKTPTLEQCQAFLDGQGPTNSLDKALLAKMNAAQLRQKIKEEKEAMDRYVAELERVRPKNQPAPPARKPLTTPAARRPAPTSKTVAAPSATAAPAQLLAHFVKLTGSAARKFYQAHGPAIRAAASSRK
jgi:cell division protein FtsN